jgi:hypothetical protein
MRTVPGWRHRAPVGLVATSPRPELVAGIPGVQAPDLAGNVVENPVDDTVQPARNQGRVGVVADNGERQRTVRSIRLGKGWRAVHASPVCSLGMPLPSANAGLVTRIVESAKTMSKPPIAPDTLPHRPLGVAEWLA